MSERTAVDTLSTPAGEPAPAPARERGSQEPARRRSPWLVAIFAHNEAGRIGAAIASLAAAADGAPLDVVVLANGCSDATADEARRSAGLVASLSIVEIDVADKANAWNTLVHEVVDDERAAALGVCFCMDGDVTLLPHALSRLATALDDLPSAHAAGAMPATGRDREGWRRRMVTYGNLPGNLYALRGSFVRRIRASGIRMPFGLIGEDFLVSWLVLTELGTRTGPPAEPVVVFDPHAQFAFRSMSPWRLGDYRRYLRRKWRYTWRGLQLEMLVKHLRAHGARAMPADVTTLYREGPLPSRLVWVGWDTPLRLAAVLKIRALRGR